MLPFINLFGLIQLPTYGLLLVIAITSAMLVSYYRSKKQGKRVEDLFIIAACAIGFGLVGGCGLYIFTTYSFEEILSIIQTQGVSALLSGLVFYGGFLFGLFGMWVGTKIAKVSFLEYIGIVLPGIPLAHAVGRIGCFCAGCCYGIPTTLPIGVVYTNPVGGAPTGIPLFPVQLLEALLNIGLFFLLKAVANCITEKKRSPLYIFYCYASWYSIIRFFLEYLRYDAIRGIYASLSTSQWISLALFVFSGIGALITFFYEKSRNRTNG